MLNTPNFMDILGISGHYRGFRYLLYCVNHTAITPILKSDSTPPGNKELIYALVVYLQRKDK